MSETAYSPEPWTTHLQRLKWRQGEHVLVSGPTSAGKTTLAASLLPRRSHVVMLVTKLKDPTFANEYKGWERLEKWPRGGPPSYMRRILLWPKPERTTRETIAKQRDVMRDALDAILHEGGRCVCVDEGLYLSDPKYLGLSTELGMLHYTGRSAGISMVTLAQRPFYIPKVVLSSITHGYFARTRDKDDLKRLADIGSVDAREVAANLAVLQDRHDYVYLNPQGDARPSVVNTRK